ncbi:hypothetical protein GCM10010497_00990 [Streptomyces cinereoruber]|uniref:Uncharacterized protein n=1 Tax=Streptomyces cinereoruber TaxID=67260 RepID=A0AAV4K8R0_9ACTN|nr:hypothetical protein GCM10010497_00990 [Streptomyces cinereoruber]
MTSDRQEATIATKAAVNSRPRTGRTYGHRRSRTRTADRSGVLGGGKGFSGIRSDLTVRH